MVSMKVLVFAAVIAVAASSPTFSHGGLIKAVTRPWWPSWKHKASDKHVYKQGERPLEPLGYLAKGVTDLAGNAGDILRDVAQLRIPATFDDAVNAVISVGRAAGGIVNAVIPGLGSVVGNIIIAIAKILICVLGSPGLSGSVLNDRRGGYGNSDDIPAICQKNYGQNYGCKPYTGAYKSPSDVIDFYGLGNCKSKVNGLIDKATNGKGVGSLSDSDRTIVELVLKISGLLSRKSSGDWSQKDIEGVSVNVSIMIGVIGNGYSDGYGPDLIDSIIDFVGPAFKSKGLDLSAHQNDIKSEVGKCGRYNFGGALKHNDDSGNSDNNGNSGNSGDSNNSNNSNDNNNSNKNTDKDNNNSSNGNDNSNKNTGKDKNDNSNGNKDSNNGNKNTDKDNNNSSNNNNNGNKNNGKDKNDTSNVNNTNNDNRNNTNNNKNDKNSKNSNDDCDDDNDSGNSKNNDGKDKTNSNGNSNKNNHKNNDNKNNNNSNDDCDDANDSDNSNKHNGKGNSNDKGKNPKKHGKKNDSNEDCDN